ncbi:hypothetical protein D3C75_426610 [compost metagenome]
MVHICSRSLPDGSGLSPLGRETSIPKVVWTDDGWLPLASGDWLPQLEVPIPILPPHPFPADSERDHFSPVSVFWNCGGRSCMRILIILITASWTRGDIGYGLDNRRLSEAYV